MAAKILEYIRFTFECILNIKIQDVAQYFRIHSHYLLEFRFDAKLTARPFGEIRRASATHFSPLRSLKNSKQMDPSGSMCTYIIIIIINQVHLRRSNVANHHPAPYKTSKISDIRSEIRSKYWAYYVQYLSVFLMIQYQKYAQILNEAYITFHSTCANTFLPALKAFNYIVSRDRPIIYFLWYRLMPTKYGISNLGYTFWYFTSIGSISRCRVQADVPDNADIMRRTNWLMQILTDFSL